MDRSIAETSMHNTLKTHKSITAPGFEPAVSVSYRPQVHALALEATGIGYLRNGY
jgi:hypothetical protein